ncbi:MAG: DNA-binding protein [Rhodoferax sp.]|nr:DNA-binding protein [Rhodoferax sp.]MCF8210387.1 DNA-binding protein [Rhodoferax sp.]
MRPTEFSTEEIVKAGLELQSAGRNVTGFALRQKVGGGNASRLRQVWDEHLSAQSITTVQQVVELPIEVAEQLNLVTAALTERLTHLTTDLNDRAVKAAERRVAEIVKASGVQRSAAERELADAGQTVDDLEEKLDAATVENERLRKTLEEVNAKNQSLAVEMAQVKERLIAVESTYESCAKQLQQAQLQHSVDLQEITAAREAAANSAGRVQALEQQIGEIFKKFTVQP